VRSSTPYDYTKLFVFAFEFKGRIGQESSTLQGQIKISFGSGFVYIFLKKLGQGN
jgi:hypothetical protein